jgi:hypothetical protein
MARQPFARLVDGDPPLMRAVEAIVLAAHRDWYEASGRSDWTEPKAYHWLHYEDPDPVARLADGVRRLEPGLAAREPEIDAVLALARHQGRLE